MSKAIQTADLDWQFIDGIEIPRSKRFGDIYFSKDNGLLETRHVFLNGNHLTERLSSLHDFEYFHIGETGFGTGLNILSLLQLWQNIRPDNHSYLQVTSVEKFPLTQADLIRALNAWPELAHLSKQLIEQYPLPISGCHRLSFPNERFSIDLWLGDAKDIFPNLVKTAPINAWFLDGFAPSCNPDIWQENILEHIVRLSDIGTTYASFSVAGVLKRGLKKHGVDISRPAGFGHKSEMLTGILEQTFPVATDLIAEKSQKCVEQTRKTAPLIHKQRQIAVIGAGIAGLSSAYALAQHGHQVHIFDQSAPLSGASGNPLALLNPRLAPIHQNNEHFITLSWKSALSHYPKFKAFRSIEVNQIDQKNSEEFLALAAQYPIEILEVIFKNASALRTNFDSLKFKMAGVIQPHVLADEILSHPNIQFTQAHIQQCIKQDDALIALITATPSDTSGTSTPTPLNSANCMAQHFDHVIVCSGVASQQLLDQLPALKPIRGQVSWVNNTDSPLNMNQAYSYGGYCMQLDTEQLIIGASFCPERDDVDVQLEDHQHNLNLLNDVFPDYAKRLKPIDQWQGRASVRAQSLDYFPLLGKVQDDLEIYAFTGLGSRGFLYAPLCSDILVAQILKHACPAPIGLLRKLSPKRFQKKVKPKKPYYQKPS